MRITMSPKGQIVLPAELRRKDNILPGQLFELERVETGRYLLKKVPARGKPGLVAWLQSCPVQGWFQNIPSESTADL